MGKEITLQQISEEVGIGKTTVSRVLNNRPIHCTPQTRARILATAKRLNYRPNLVAQSLRRGKTHAIGLVAPLLNLELDRVEHGCRQAGYTLTVTAAQRDAKLQSEGVLHLRQRGVDGIILVSPVPGCDVIDGLQAEGYPIVISDVAPAYPKVDSFLRDLESGVRRLVDHLVDLGHRRIATISSSKVLASGRTRDTGWREGLAAAGITPQDDWDIPLGLGDEEIYANVYRRGYQGVEEFIRRFAKNDPTRPTAVITSVDEVAVGAISGFHEAGWRVPRDISVVGMQALDVGRHCLVPVTSVDVEHVTCYLAAFDHLLTLIKDDYRGPRPIHRKFGAKLIIRESTATPPF